MINKKYLWSFPLLYLIIYSYHFIVVKYPGDDYYFSRISSEMTIIEWLYSRYTEWSSRLFPDAVAYLLLDDKVWLWRLVNPILLIFLAASIVRIWKRNISLREVLIVLAIIGFFAQNVLSSGVFWITGSMNYLWPITLGVLAMIPFADKIFRNISLTNNYSFIFAIFFGFLASVGNEQVSLCLSSFAILSHLALLSKKQSPDKKLLILTITMMIGTGLTLLAPGNKERWVQEAAYWYPGFKNLTLKDHLYLGTIWAFGKIFFDLKYLLFLASSITIITCFKSSTVKNNFIFKLFMMMFSATIMMYLSGIGLERLYQFTNIKNFDFSANLLSPFTMKKSFILAVFPYLYWTAYSLLLGYLMIKSTGYKVFVFISLLAFVATLAVMFFSPTIYGSGNRVLMASSVILGIVITGKILENNLVKNAFYLSILGCLPIINLSNILINWLKNGFNPFL
ncbi:DUF6056 family protein [Neobacillus sp. GCM10023253]|uniref:DUF6056 family protein n=1 Tax=Neobacillus sp. GCM10023253 TaxID=3252644 RepID=UPI003613C4A0